MVQDLINALSIPLIHDKIFQGTVSLEASSPRSPVCTTTLPLARAFHIPVVAQGLIRYEYLKMDKRATEKEA